MASPAIELRGVTVAFAGETLLSNINLQIAKGEIFVIIGPSGAGKSVILKLMAGIMQPSKGQVLIEGRDLAEISDSERLKLICKMGMLFQKNALFDSLTSGENIGFPLREVVHLDESAIDKKVNYFLDEVAIPQAKGLYPDEISGGMQKRLGIARALALDPEIIFYDDPTAGLDPITSRLIIDLILRLQKEQESSVVAITNDMNRAYQMANRIGMVVDGELIITGDEQQTKSHTDPRVHQFVRGALDGPLTEAE